MKLYNELKLRFDEPLWALYPELALFDTILERKPDFIQKISIDVLHGVKDSGFGRKDSPTVEQILRAAVYKEIKQLDYRTLEIDMYDSKMCSLFLKLEPGQGYSYSVMQKYISKIKESTLRDIIIEINRIAIAEKIDTVEKVSTDTTTVRSNVHYPTNNSLILDCIQKAIQLLKKIKKDKKDDQDRLEDKRKQAKKLNYEINNVKKEQMPDLFAPYLGILKELIIESWHTVRIDNKSFKHTEKLKSYLNLMLKVYRNAESFQLYGVKVENSKKIFSIHEAHTDILTKGERETEFGHKVLFSTGASNLILDFCVPTGNPNDKLLLIPSIDNIIKNYQTIPKSTSNDGGFICTKNIEKCQKHGIINIVFTKVTKSLKNIVTDLDVEKELKKWRGRIEAVISNIKRGFGLERVTWEGFDKFCAKVAWSVLGYNLRTICNRLLT